jgi:hypothetical protein
MRAVTPQARRLVPDPQAALAKCQLRLLNEADESC